jgi:hypothetical protein
MINFEQTDSLVKVYGATGGKVWLNIGIITGSLRKDGLTAQTTRVGRFIEILKLACGKRTLKRSPLFKHGS